MAEKTRNQTLTVFMTSLTSPTVNVLVREHASVTVKVQKRNIPLKGGPNIQAHAREKSALLVYFCYMLPCTFVYSINIAVSAFVTRTLMREHSIR